MSNKKKKRKRPKNKKLNATQKAAKIENSFYKAFIAKLDDPRS